MARVRIGRIQLERPLIVEDRVGEVVLLEQGVAQVAIQLRRLQAEGAQVRPGARGAGPVAVGIGGDTRRPQRVGAGGRLRRAALGGQQQEQRQQGGGSAGALAGISLHMLVDGGNDRDRLLVMGIHRLVAGIRRVASELARVQQAGEFGRQRFAGAAFDQPGRNVFLAHVRGIQVELVRDEAQQGAVQLLIEGGVEIALQEGTRLGEPLAGHLGGAAVLAADHVGTQRKDAADQEIGGGAQHEQQHRQDPESGRTDEEIADGRERARGGGDEADVAAQVAHVLAVHAGDELAAGRGAGVGALTHPDRERLAAQGHVFPRGKVEIGIFHGAEREFAVAARNERIFEYLAAGHVGSLDVIDLEIGRE